MANFRQDLPLLLTCCYDSNHKVAPSRWSQHVADCAKKSTKILKTCPFNSLHRIEPELYDAHLVSCVDAQRQDRQSILRELGEWNNFEPEKNGNDVTKLTNQMRGVNIQSDQPAPSTSASSWGSWTDWDTETTGSSEYLAPGLENPSLNASSAHGGNVFNYQMLKPAQKKKLSERLVQETLARKREQEMAPILTAQEEKALEEKQKLEKKKKEEEKRLEKEREEREKAKNARLARKKIAKAKEKEAKRAAFHAKQAQGKDQEQNEEEEEEEEEDETNRNE